MFVNLESYDGPVVMVSITAPGTDRLPWDEAHCRHPNGGEHSGKRGCRVEVRAAAEWTETATMRYGMLRQAATRHVRTHAPVPVRLLERVWEPQKRGIPHLHLVLGVKTREELEAAGAFVAKLKEIAPDYEFGHVDARGKKGSRNERVVVRGQILKLVKPEDAARYLSAYLTGRSRHKPSIRETVADPAMSFLAGREKRQALPIVWLTPKLTSIKRGGTGVTMRTLRRARHLWAAAFKGMCDFPKWTDIYEAIYVGATCRRAFALRGEADQGPPLEELLESALAIADKTMAKLDMMPKTGPNSWARRYHAEQAIGEFADQLATHVAGIKRQEAPALAVAA